MQKLVKNAKQAANMDMADEIISTAKSRLFRCNSVETALIHQKCG